MTHNVTKLVKTGLSGNARISSVPLYRNAHRTSLRAELIDYNAA